MLRQVITVGHVREELVSPLWFHVRVAIRNSNRMKH
jgi:hypothetical protein